MSGGKAIILLGIGLAAALALIGGAALAQTAFDSSFDHFTTGWPLEGAHRSVECAGCHVGGVFEGAVEGTLVNEVSATVYFNAKAVLGLVR